jgi:hypothetical protein
MTALDGGALPLPLKGREIAIFLPLQGGGNIFNSSPFKGEVRRGMGFPGSQYSIIPSFHFSSGRNDVGSF